MEESKKGREEKREIKLKINEKKLEWNEKKLERNKHQIKIAKTSMQQTQRTMIYLTHSCMKRKIIKQNFTKYICMFQIKLHLC